MVEFETIISQFADQGEKTGWSYIDIPTDIAQQLKPGNKKSFRVRGKLDGLKVKGMALMPMGNGNFIMALKTEVRERPLQNAGAMLHLSIEEDVDYKVEIPDDLQECFDFEPEALDFLIALQNHTAITSSNGLSLQKPVRPAKRVVNTVNAMLRKLPYNVMLREMSKEG